MTDRDLPLSHKLLELELPIAELEIRSLAEPCAEVHVMTVVVVNERRAVVVSHDHDVVSILTNLALGKCAEAITFVGRASLIIFRIGEVATATRCERCDANAD